MSIVKHGLARRSGRHPLYFIWGNIVSRCYLPSNPKFKNYGARGIEVCDEWRFSFGAFHRYMLSIGWSKGKSIDRVDNNSDYKPGNIRITDVVVQNNNRTSNKHVTIFGDTKTLAEWGRDSRSKVSYRVFRQRILRGWEPLKALTHTSERKNESPV